MGLHCPSYFIAGVTLLSFGNGSPDVFTMIAARNGARFLTGINTLIGGVVIVSTIVVGAVTLSVPYKLHLNPIEFLRDIAFLLATVSIILVATLYNSSPLLIAGLLLLCYGVYIALVFFQGDTSQLQYDALEHEAERQALAEFLADRQAIHERESALNKALARLEAVYTALEFPIRALQHCTIPLLEATMQNYVLWKNYWWTYPIAIPVLMGVWLDSTDFAADLQDTTIITICIAVGLGLTTCLYCLPAPVAEPIIPATPDPWGEYPSAAEHSSQARLKRISLFIWLFVAFCSCIMWIDLTANTLVSALTDVGKEMGIPSEFLGLTVLAWGNSIGDCITDTALARQGRGLMALSGCYGGPLFNMVAGLGIALLLNGIEGGKVSFTAEGEGEIGSLMDADYAVQSLLISVVFLYLVLGSSAVLLHCQGYELSSSVGIYLIVVYVAYSVSQGVLLFWNRS